MTDTGELVYVEIEGERLRVVRRGIRFLLYDEWSSGICGEARCVELADGSYWIAARKLTGGSGWIGERVGTQSQERYMARG